MVWGSQAKGDPPKSAVDFLQTGSWAHIGPKNSANRYKIIPA